MQHAMRLAWRGGTGLGLWNDWRPLSGGMQRPREVPEVGRVLITGPFLLFEPWPRTQDSSSDAHSINHSLKGAAKMARKCWNSYWFPPCS